MRHPVWLLLGLLICCPLPALSAEPGRAETLIIATVSDSPQRHYQRLLPMVEYVAAQLTPWGIRQGKVKLADNHQQMLQWLRDGQVDWITETPFAATLFQQAGAEIVLKRDKRGSFTYRSLWVVRADSPLRYLRELRGQRVAFEDPGSTSAFFLPSLSLLERGLALAPLDQPRQAPPADRVGFLFSRKEINTTLWIHKGLVAAGALSSNDWDNPKRVPPSLKPQLRILHQSPPYPRTLELLRQDLAPSLKEAIVHILLQHTAPLPPDILAAYDKTTRFMRLTPDDHQALQHIASQLDRLKAFME